MAEVKYHRVVIKLSGEALAEDEGSGIDPMRAANIAKRVSDIHNMGVDVSMVIGAGNLWRGREGLNWGWIEPPPTTWVCWQRS